MKRLLILTILTIVALALASCYWMGNFDNGVIRMDFSKFQPKAPGEVVRVYLIANGLLFSTDSNVPFAAEVPLALGNAETIIEIDGLPVGPSYRAMIGVGPITGGVFQPRAYGETVEFQINSGGDTPVSPTIDSLYYFYGVFISADLRGKNLSGVTTGRFSNMYAAEPAKIYLIDGSGNVLDSYDLAADPSEHGVSSVRINSLSRDDSGGFFRDAFINSNRGIVPFDYGEGWSFDTSFSSGLGGDRQIEESGVFNLGNDRALFFRRQDGLGGKNIGLSGGDWINLNTDAVTDMTHGNPNAYFATDGGAFALPWDFLLDSPPQLAAKRMDFSGPAKILSLGYVPPSVSPAQIIMGTTNGVWEGDITSESPVTLGTLSQVPETAGNAIEMIDLSRNNPGTYQAYLSRYYLYIREGSFIYKFPFFAILPGKVTGMSWDSNSNWLYVSGTDGLSVLHVGS